MKKGLVLAGGGTRGSYQCGAIKALVELNQDNWNIVTGTSIGALNALFVVYRNYELMAEMWRDVKPEDIINGAIPQVDLSTMIQEKKTVKQFVHNYVKDKGADITPLVKRIERNFDPIRFQESDIDYGCIVVHWKTKKPVYVSKEMILNQGIDWLVATASAFPAFPIREINGEGYVDGGYYDNLPIDYALRMGAEELIAIDLNNEPQHPNYLDRPYIHYIFPKVHTGSFLDFDAKTSKRLEVLGYLDTLKEYGVYSGYKYTFEKMNVPSWFHSFYLHVLMLETKIKEANELNNVFRSNQVISDHILNAQYKKVLSLDDMFFGFMDSLMDLIGMDIEKIYSYVEVKDSIIESFSESFDYAYQYKPENKTPKELIEYTKALDKKVIVELLVHSQLYKDHGIFTENMRLTVHPYEKALADFIVYMKKEEEEK